MHVQVLPVWHQLNHSPPSDSGSSFWQLLLAESAPAAAVTHNAAGPAPDTSLQHRPDELQQQAVRVVRTAWQWEASWGSGSATLDADSPGGSGSCCTGNASID